MLTAAAVTQAKWWGFYLGEGHWIVNTRSERIAFENEDQAIGWLSSKQDEGDWRNAVVKEFPVAPYGIALGF